MKRNYASFSELAFEALDFARCKRLDGTYYGIADGKQCRRGRPVGPAEMEMLKKAAASGNRRAKAALDVVQGRKTREQARNELAKAQAVGGKPPVKEVSNIAKKEEPKKAESASLTDRFDKAKKLGEGGYAEVRVTKDGTVIKKGELGYAEERAQKALEGVDGIPRIRNRDGNLIEMDMARGKPIMSTDLIGADKPTPLSKQAAEELVRLNREMHTRNISHGDQHDGNFFFDAKSRKGGMIDFGMAQYDSPWSALEEGLKLGSASDYKSSGMLNDLAGPRGSGGARSNAGPMLAKFEQNQQAVIKRLKADGYDPEDGLEGVGISRDAAEGYIKQLYDGV